MPTVLGGNHTDAAMGCERIPCSVKQGLSERRSGREFDGAGKRPATIRRPEFAVPRRSLFLVVVLDEEQGHRMSPGLLQRLRVQPLPARIFQPGFRVGVIHHGQHVGLNCCQTSGELVPLFDGQQWKLWSPFRVGDGSVLAEHYRGGCGMQFYVAPRDGRLADVELNCGFEDIGTDLQTRRGTTSSA